jgi:hypothetical protein
MRPVSELVPTTLQRVLREQPLTDAKVQFAWRTSAGAAMARATSIELDPRGTLHVRVESPHWEAEVLRAAADLRTRLAGMLGPDVLRWVSVELTRAPRDLFGTAPPPPSGDTGQPAKPMRATVCPGGQKKPGRSRSKISGGLLD